MKKRYIIVFLFGIICLTGCSNNTLKCTIKNKTLNSKYTITFQENMIKSLSLKEEKIYDKMDASIELDYYEEIDKYSPLENLNGIKYNIKETKDKIKKTLDVDYTLLEQDSGIIGISKASTKEVAKSYLENIGYTCK